ncbi:hypothetical protein [Rhodoferax lithotrophicus]|nr:hypothetical protein [Rhodoferax sp. MIZ03]
MTTPTKFPITNPRSVEALITGQASSDGVGGSLTRVLAQDLQRLGQPL